MLKKSLVFIYKYYSKGQGGKVRDYTDLTLLQHYKDKQLPFGRLSLRKVINNAENAIKL